MELHQKQDIEVKNQDIRLKNQDIAWKGLSPVSARHAQKLYDFFGNEGVFSRSQVTEILGITPSPASELLRKLLAAPPNHQSERQRKRQVPLYSSSARGRG